MRQIAKDALAHVLGAKEGEHLLVVTDEQRIEIGNAFYEAGDRLGLEGRLFVLEDNERPLEELPIDLRRALEGADVMVSVFIAYPEETPFRIKLLKAAEESGARVGHGPGITDDMMLEGAMRVDYQELIGVSEKVRRDLKGAVRAHLTSPGGTDLWLTLRGREFITDTRIGPGAFGNLPPGEVWGAPVETEAQGTFVCDAAIGDLGTVSQPLTIELVAGHITSIQGEDGALLERVRQLVSLDDQASMIGEIGIGINPSARITGNLLEDEKAAGTVHIAFGSNEETPGGQNTSRTHRDFHMRSPTLTIEFEDGKTRTLVRDGRLVD